MQRASDSHKGENGKVAIIGGSPSMHGAPLLAALAAEASGVDLITVCLPACHCEVAKTTSLNFQVHPFQSDHLRREDTEAILELLATIDCAVVGPGISHADGKSIAALEDIIAEAPCRLVLDATALQPSTLGLASGKNAVLTPHLAELERMEVDPADLGARATEAGVTIFLKGPTDHIAGSAGRSEEISGGNAGLTVGGTGDALAGLIAGLIAQGIDAFDAAVTAGRVMKRAATVLYPERGYAFTAREIIRQIPHLLHAIDN